MAQYIIAYHGGKQPATPEEGKAQIAKYQAWLAGLGEAVVNPGTPFRITKMVTQEGVSDPAEESRLTGFTTVEAESMDVAVAMAQSCPFLEIGTLEVAEVVDMKSMQR